MDPQIFLTVKGFQSNKAFISGSFEDGDIDAGISSIKTKMITLMFNYFASIRSSGSNI